MNIKNDTIFEVKEEHIKLLKNMYTSWNNGMTGAPTIDPKRPYGNKDIYKDMIKILDIDYIFGSEEINCLFDTELQDKLDDLHIETETALQILLSNLSIETGKYQRINYSNQWKKIK